MLKIACSLIIKLFQSRKQLENPRRIRSVMLQRSNEGDSRLITISPPEWSDFML